MPPCSASSQGHPVGASGQASNQRINRCRVCGIKIEGAGKVEFLKNLFGFIVPGEQTHRPARKCTLGGRFTHQNFWGGVAGVVLDSLVQRIDDAFLAFETLQIESVNKAHGPGNTQYTVVFAGRGEDIFKLKRQRSAGPTDINNAKQHGFYLDDNECAAFL